MTSYVPERGDLVWLEFDPQAGHEQAGKRPALVLSPQRYNRLSGLMLCCPITTRVKGYPFEVALTDERGVDSVVLSDQVKSLDWRARRASRKARAPSAVLQEALAKLGTLLGAE
jgi:mRNA interferase MazF